MNLDPFERHSDDEVWSAMKQAHLETFVQSLPEQLEFICSEGGDNLRSVNVVPPSALQVERSLYWPSGVDVGIGPHLSLSQSP